MSIKIIPTMRVSKAASDNSTVTPSFVRILTKVDNNIKPPLNKRLFKEVGLSLINGFFLAIFLVLFGYFTGQELVLSLTVASSMMSVIVMAALIGTFVPIVLEKRGIDPAIATGPFITTANDIFGIFLFFFMAQQILGF